MPEEGGKDLVNLIYSPPEVDAVVPKGQPLHPVVGARWSPLCADDVFTACDVPPFYVTAV